VTHLLVQPNYGDNMQLVTSEPDAIDIPKAQLKQSLPCSFHVPTTRHSLASKYPVPAKYVSASEHHQGMCLDFVKITPLFRHVVEAGTDSHVPFTFFWPIECMASLTMH
jgi:hypothetical protein